MRYFYVTYIYALRNGFGCGSLGRRQTEGYPSKAELISSITEKNVTILGVQEMTEGDFNDFFDLKKPDSEASTK